MAQGIKDFAIDVYSEVETLVGRELTDEEQQIINDNCMDYWIDQCSVEYTAVQLVHFINNN